MEFTRYAMVCDKCTSWLPGIDSVFDTWFTSDYSMYRQARKLGWRIQVYTETGESKNTCPSCQ